MTHLIGKSAKENSVILGGAGTGITELLKGTVSLMDSDSNIARKTSGILYECH